MADNIVLNATSGGPTAATKDIGSGVQAQRVQPVWGAAGVGTDVDVASGLPVQSGWKELTGSASANNADLVSADVSGYRWVSVQITGTFSATVSFQQSNDGTNWVSTILSSNSTPGATTLSVGVFSGPVTSRYFRARTTAYSSGTVVGTVELSTLPSQYISTFVYAGSAFSVSGGGSASGDAQSGPTVFAADVMGYNGATWDRIRVPNTFKTVSATASGSTSVWTPAASKKFRLMRFKLDVTQDASQTTGGDITLTFVDSASNTAIVQTVFVPGTAATTMGSGWTSGWVDLGNGILSATINNVLNISLSAALTSGAVRVLTAGCEE